MGIKLDDIVGNKHEELLVDKTKKTMNYLMIAVAIVVILIVIVAIKIVLNNISEKNKETAAKMCRDADMLSMVVKEKYIEAKQTGDESGLIGINQDTITDENQIVKKTVNKQTLEFRHGYYYLTSSQASDMISGGLQVKANYMVKYSTGEVVNLTGVEWKGTRFYEVEDLKAISEGKTPPSLNTFFINSPNDMQKFAQNPNAIFRLNKDIDMNYYANGDGWTPIPVFSGKFDGRGYKISNLRINNSSQPKAGLFGEISADAVVKNLVLENIDVIGGDYTGGVAGACRGTIENCKVTGRVASTGRYVGGIFGNFEGTASNVRAEVNTSGGQYVGGFAGQITGGDVVECYVKGITVVGNEDCTGGFAGYVTTQRDVNISEVCANTSISGKKNVGGLLGSITIPNSNYKVEIANSYSQGTIKDCNENAGGFVGEISTSASAFISLKYNYTTCKPTVNCDRGRGGFVGSIARANGTSVTYCFWERQNLDSSLEENGVGTTNESTLRFDPLTPEAIRQQRNYTGWDSVIKLWRFNGKDAPTLSWE